MAAKSWRDIEETRAWAAVKNGRILKVAFHKSAFEVDDKVTGKLEYDRVVRVRVVPVSLRG